MLSVVDTEHRIFYRYVECFHAGCGTILCTVVPSVVILCSYAMLCVSVAWYSNADCSYAECIDAVSHFSQRCNVGCSYADCCAILCVIVAW